MRKKNKLLMVSGIIIIILITAFAVVSIIKGSKNKENIIFSTTSVEQRKVWNEFLNINPYLSQIDTMTYIEETDLIKLALTSDNVEKESISLEEAEQNPSLTTGDGYKKSINNINEYLKSFLGVEEVAYNFVDTFFEEGSYLIIGEEYVYFTTMELPEKIYIAVNYNNENNNYEVEIYEYNITESNKESLNKMLETGEINGEIETSGKYILTGQILNNSIKINTKTAL